MLLAAKLNLPNTSIPKPNSSFTSSTLVTHISLPRRHQLRPITCFAVQSNNSIPQTAAATSEPLISTQQHYSSAVGSPAFQPSSWNLTQRHIVVLNVIACATAVLATWLFCAAIPTLLAFKRAAESLEQLMDVAREELPDTMAAVRLSGMEISDLTMELNDLGQGLTRGVKCSTRAVRVAEEKLQQLANMTSPGNRHPEN